MIEKPNKPLLGLLESFSLGPGLDIVGRWKEKRSIAVDVTGQGPVGVLTDLESTV